MSTFCFCSFTVFNELKERLIAVWSDFRQDIIDTAIEHWRKGLRACLHASGGHFKHLLLTNSGENGMFRMFFVQVDSIHRARFLLC